MKTLNLKEMEVVEGGRFLGWGWNEFGPAREVSDPSCASGIAVEQKWVYTVFYLETSRDKTTHTCSEDLTGVE
ncbi:MAG: hypothetical protein ACQUHE_13130 [Bacteroidia bacterium]